jgi:signal transduction histidine kinase
METPRSSRILVVDDEPRNVKLLEALLVRQGYQVICAGDGQEALRLLDAQPVDLILLDVMMPGMDGFSLTRQLRAGPRTRLIPIVLVTSLTDTDDRIKGIEAGCDDFISKPFDQQEVLARVKTLLTLSYYRSLLDEKAQLDYVIEHMEDGLVILEDTLGVHRLNGRAAMWLGLDPAAGCADFPEYVQRVFRVRYAGQLREDLLRQGISFDVERPEGATAKALVLEAKSSIVRDPDGRISSIVLLLQDVTDLRQETTLKQNFLGLISHKLRTPAAVITVNASVLQDGVFGPLSEPQRSAIQTILDTTQKLGELIDKLLAFTILHEQASRLGWEPVVPHEHLQKMLEPLLKRLNAKPVELDIQGPDGQAPVVVNRGALELIVGHLVENAIKFNDKDRIQVRLAISQRPGGWLRIAISDNGPGIPPEEQEHIFESFYQVDKDFTGNVQGAGLGLALVKRLVAASGGTIQVRSELGRGATFVFTLPIVA